MVPKPSNAKKRLFKDNRAQSVGITMAKMPPINKIVDALEKMDTTILNHSQILSLIREFITDEELSEYEAQNEPDSIWEKQEEFVIALSKISFAKIKLNVWKFTFDYIENYESVNSTLENTKHACKEIKENPIIKKLFSYILTIGNILNGGSNKGQADGFNLDILTKINSIKDINGKTILQYVCSQILKEETGLDGIKKKFPYLSESAKIIFSENQGTLNKLKKGLKEGLENVKNLTVNDSFTKKASSMFEKYSIEIEDLEKTFADNLKSIQELILFYGYTENDTKYKNPEEFFIIMNDFITEVEKALPKTEPKKVFNRKYEVGKKLIENTGVMDDLLKIVKSRNNNS